MRPAAWIVTLLLGFGTAAGIVAWIGDGGGTFSVEGGLVGTVSHSAATAGYPRQWTDALEYPLSLSAPPSAIASQALVTDHLLFGVVPEAQILAVSPYAAQPSYSNIAARVRELQLPTVRDPESVLALEPSLLLASQISSPEFLRMVRASGLPVYAMRTMFSDLDEIADALRLVGDLSGQGERAERASEEFTASVWEAGRRVAPGLPPQRVLGYSYFGDCYGRGSLFEDIVTGLGAVNVGSEQGLGAWERIGSEQVAAWDPDWIVTGTGGQSPDEVRASLLADPAVMLTAAGRRNQVLVIHDRHFLAMSQHVAGMVHAMANALYPHHDARR